VSDAIARQVTVREDGRSLRAIVVEPIGAHPGSCPVVAFGNGYAQEAYRYRSILEDLAARGYVAIAPDGETGLWPSHARLAEDLWRSIRWARAQVRAAHPARCAVAGHSMGGGAALLAAARHPQIDTVVTFAAAETRPSAIDAVRDLTVDALFVVGSRDRLVRPSRTRRLYAAKPPPSTFATIVGGYHCGFLDSVSYGGIGCDRGSITREEQLATTRALLAGWLDHHLLGLPPSPAPPGVVVEPA
jgi:dienelactone hydrolase